MRTFNFDDGACSGHSMVGTTKNCCSKLTYNQRNRKYHSSRYQKHFLQYNQNQYLSNIHYKTSHLPVCQGILKNVLSLCLILLIVCVRDSVCTYLNQVAVHIEGGLSKADEVAFRHGFINLGKVSLSIFLKLIKFSYVCLLYVVFTKNQFFYLLIPFYYIQKFIKQ